MDYLRSITFDEMILRATKASKCLLDYAPSSNATRDFKELAKIITSQDSASALSGGLQFFVERMTMNQARVG